jgi:hypothetical protein
MSLQVKHARNFLRLCGVYVQDENSKTSNARVYRNDPRLSKNKIEREKKKKKVEHPDISK